ncbi:MAG: pseudaminic acid cytidylyltransferase [Candidatus Riflebacteria bacterium]|nr:pseudaminic acid cytidylyltransferase [Candidatus Riflebacteria bacterium]
MKTLALITARGGSKRIPRKNIRNFFSKPIMSYPIEAAIESNIFDKVMVSTDDQEIADIAVKYGAEMPFFRSAQNSNDTSGTLDVIIEVLRELEKRGEYFDYLCCIYPTAVFVTADKLRSVFKKIQETKANGAFPVIRFSTPIQRALIKTENGFAKMKWPEFGSFRSQDLEPSFHDAGQYYWLKTSQIKEGVSLFEMNLLGIETPESEAQDIDNEEDWLMAEIKYDLLKKKKS